jgi:class 3 adenylate cyclase
MASRTRYARAGDVHIAWAELGDGPVDLVFCSAYVSHVEHLLAHPLPAALFERLARFCRVILFDRRGSGLSDRVLSVPTLEEQMEDIIAVMDAAGSEHAALLGFTGGGPLAILAAATHPTRCSALVLAQTFARTGWAPGYEWAPNDEARKAARAHMFATWGDGSRARTMFPSAADDPSFVGWFGALERLSAGPGDARHVFGLLDEVDVRDALPAVQAPTLVFYAEEQVFLDVRHCEYLARRIPGARLVTYPGGDALPLTRAGRDVFVGHIEELLTGDRHGPETDRALATVMFTDIVDSTGLTEPLGDDAAMAFVRVHDKIVREALGALGGREVKHTGDGIMACFVSTVAAVRCATQIQRGLAEHEQVHRQMSVKVRIGAAAGEPVEDHMDLFGSTVQLAARLCSHAEPQQSLVSNAVAELCIGKGMMFVDLGEISLKGFERPVRVHAVQ